MKLMSHLKFFSDESGAGTSLTLGAMAVVLSLTTGLLTSMSIFSQWNEAKRVADQAALAGSMDIIRDPSQVCLAASEIVIANGFAIDQCNVSEENIVVQVGFIPEAHLAKLAFPRLQVYSVATVESGL